jgi:hypothetical protein
MMSKTPKAEKPTELRVQESGPREAVVGKCVMFDLGRPADLNRIQAKCVWGDYYRVNIFVGENIASSKIAHSFFVKADENGKILSCSPPITRMY